MSNIFSSTYSNSSFIECVRKHDKLQHPFSNDVPQCTSTLYSQDTPCQYTGQGLSYSSGTNIFKYVEFKSCWSSVNGGAISCTGGTLSVLSSSFSSCSANGKKGGAIYAFSLSLLSVQNSLFNPSGGSHQTTSGGAIALNSVLLMSISSSLFIRCFSSGDAGAIDMRNCGSEQRNVPISCCSFLSCECWYDSGSSGGAFEVSGSKCYFFSCSLFSSCKAIQGGGAMWLEPSFVTNAISFSFFTANNAQSNQGRDCYIRVQTSVALFLHSFSLSSEPHLSASDSNWKLLNLPNNWLPQGCNSFRTWSND